MPPGVGKRRLSMLEWAPSETNSPRRGGPLCPPARVELRVVAVSNVGITVVSLARWMHRVRADAAGRYEIPA